MSTRVEELLMPWRRSCVRSLGSRQVRLGQVIRCQFEAWPQWWQAEGMVVAGFGGCRGVLGVLVTVLGLLVIVVEEM
jgi:hypothetical protein